MIIIVVKLGHIISRMMNLFFYFHLILHDLMGFKQIYSDWSFKIGLYYKIIIVRASMYKLKVERANNSNGNAKERNTR